MRKLGILGGVVAMACLALGLIGTASVSATVLCKTATNPCSGGTYAKGATIEASLKSGTKFSLTTGFGEVRCSESTIKGEVSNAGGEAVNATIAITSFSLGECNCGAKVLKSGSWSVEAPEGGNGKLVSNGTETTFECLEIHCIFSTSSTSIGTLKGGEAAAIAMESTLPRTGGRSGASCGSFGTLKAEYTITTPTNLYVEEKFDPSTVLCKTSSNPCSGGTYPKGTTIEASLKSGTKSKLKSAFIGEVVCDAASIKGEVTDPGGEGAKVSGTIASLGFSSCNGTVTVLKKGTFVIESPLEGNGTLKLEGLETTVELAGLHCIYSGPASLSLKGDEMASITGPSSLERTGGRSGALCGKGREDTWNAEYTITAPEPLYVEGI